MPNRQVVGLFVSGLLLMLLPSFLGHANDVYPSDMPLLKLETAQGNAYSFTLEDLARLPGRTVEGKLPDIGDSMAQWHGVPLSALLASLDLTVPERMEAIAMDGYSDTIPAFDIATFDPLVAYMRNGSLLSIAEHGPLVIMYPYAEHDALLQRKYYSRTVWRLNRLRMVP